MFADNEKISTRQQIRLLTLDWAGKFCLLLPILLSSLDGTAMMASLCLGTATAFFYSIVLGFIAKKLQNNMYSYVKERLGKGVAVLTGMIFLGYFLGNEVYLTWAVSRVSSVFLLPENSEYVIGLIYLAAGWLTARGSVQKRARAAECLFPVVAVMLIVMLTASAGSVSWKNFEQAFWLAPQTVKNTIYGSVSVFAVYAGMGVTLYQIPCLKRKTQLARILKKSVVVIGIFMIVLFLVLLGAFGITDLQQLSWPVLVLMSNVNIPGGFLQRWDVIFLSVLLFSLLTAAGTGIYYMGRILKDYFPKQKEENLQISCLAVSGVIFVLGNDYEQVEQLFVNWVLWGLIPILVAIPLILAMLERVAICKKQKES